MKGEREIGGDGVKDEEGGREGWTEGGREVVRSRRSEGRVRRKEGEERETMRKKQKKRRIRGANRT
jgi:hypothetical protein